MDDRSQGAGSVPEFNDDDIAMLLAALAGGTRRVQHVELPGRTVWIKRYGRSEPRLVARLMRLVSRLTGQDVLRPSPLLDTQGMLDRESRQINAFFEAGFLTPTVLHRSGNAIVLSNLGRSVIKQMEALKRTDALAHDALLVRCALELGRVHAAGLCHGRPHPRDFVLDGDRFGFLDFEEEPAAAMPLATAQARDVFLLFLQVTSRCLRPETPSLALEAWRASRPVEAETALYRVMPFFSGLLPLARFFARIRAGEDLIRFIAAADFLCSATGVRQAEYEFATLPHQGRTE